MYLVTCNRCLIKLLLNLKLFVISTVVDLTIENRNTFFSHLLQYLEKFLFHSCFFSCTFLILIKI